MKKLTLLVVSVLLSFMSFAQDYGKVLKTSQLDFINNDWVTKQTLYPKDFYIIINGSTVTVGNRKFLTYGDPTTTYHEGFVCYSWDCLDPDGNKCTFMMKKFTETKHMVYMFVYTQMLLAFEYIIE